MGFKKFTANPKKTTKKNAKAKPKKKVNGSTVEFTFVDEQGKDLNWEPWVITLEKFDTLSNIAAQRNMTFEEFIIHALKSYIDVKEKETV
jgi:hypothetical protein